MKIVFPSSTVPNLRWFKAYYVSVFSEDKINADRQFLAVQTLLKANPAIGHPSDNVDGAREFHVLRTPFTFIYRVRQDRIEVLRILDTHADWDVSDE